jgi:predicted RND superfamily exporter protein
MKFVRAWLGWVAGHRRAVLGGVLLLTLLGVARSIDLSTLQPRFHIDPSAEALLPQHNGERAVLDKVRRTFGTSDPLIAAVCFPKPVLSAENLQRVAKINAGLGALPDVRGVLSLATAPNLLSSGEDLTVSSFTEQARLRPLSIAQMPAQLAANPLYRGTLVSADGRCAAFAVDFDGMNAGQYQHLNIEQRIRTLATDIVPDASVWITGSLSVRAATSRALLQTLKFTVPAVFGAITLLLLLTFRSPRAALAALLTIGAALVLTVAATAVLGLSFNLVTAIVPPLVITIGLSYTIHLLAAWYVSRQMVPEASGPERVLWVMRRIGVGLALSATTTIVGFLSLLLNPLPAIHQFAWLASLGTFLVAVLTLNVMPTLLSALGANEAPAVGQRWFARWGPMLAEFDIRNRRFIIAVALASVLFDVAFATRIRTGADFIASFGEHSQVRHDFEAINRAFDGANLISIYVDTRVDGALAAPEQMRPLDDLESWLRQQPEVGAVSSYVDYVKLLNRALGGGDRADARDLAIPDSAAAVKQLLVFAGGDAARSMVDADFRTAVITVRLKVDGSIAIGDFLHRLDQRLAQLPPAFAAQATGSNVLATHAVEAIASGHLASIAIATLAICVLLTFMFTSLRAGLLATLPNLIPVAVYFGTLGLLHINLNPTTSLIACIVLGIAVNDTVHFLARFNADARATGSEREALRSAMATVLRPITLATVALCVGFLSFTVGELRNQAQFGALAAWTLFVAWLFDMTLTPALGSRLHIVTLWDILRIDLGRSPQLTIPLFEGLSSRQARIFALLSRIEELPAGARLIQEGDEARDIYLVIDGQLEASVDRHGERRVLTMLTRGATLGETGFFGQRRTASVDAVTPSRVLRFDSDDLDRLRLRHPRIAAAIFRNLNRVQAERLARATALVS